jgi:hypothetical protein
MALGTFIAGAFTGTLNSVALGITEDGYDLQWEPKNEAIERSDVYADMLIDMVYRGVNWFVQGEFMEDKAGPRAATHPWGASLGLPGTVARLASDVATSLVLTSTPLTPAASTPATLTAPKTILAPGFNPHAVFTSRLRTFPFRLAMLLYDSGAGVMKNFVLT